MKCPICKDVLNYPEDEMVFLTYDNDDMSYQDAMDYGYHRAICITCHDDEAESR